MESQVIDPADIKEFGSAVVLPIGSRVVLIEEDTTNLRYHKVMGQKSIPMGHLEEGETPLDCAIRETLEEAGLKLKSCIQVGIIVFLDTNDEYISIHVFIGEADYDNRPSDAIPIKEVEIAELEGMKARGELRFPTMIAIDMVMNHIQNQDHMNFVTVAQLV